MIYYQTPVSFSKRCPLSVRLWGCLAPCQRLSSKLASRDPGPALDTIIMKLKTQLWVVLLYSGLTQNNSKQASPPFPCCLESIKGAESTPRLLSSWTLSQLLGVVHPFGNGFVFFWNIKHSKAQISNNKYKIDSFCCCCFLLCLLIEILSEWPGPWIENIFTHLSFCIIFGLKLSEF